MDETGVLGLLEELSILLEDSKPVFGKGNMRQVDIAAEFSIFSFGVFPSSPLSPAVPFREASHSSSVPR